jgi:hypothetical protein
MIRPGACLLSLLCLLAVGCGTDSQGVDACRKIEQARCRRAGASCPELGRAADQVVACIEFARDQCLHGLAVPDPGAPIVDKCASAIENPSTGCTLVASPQNIPDCTFLAPSPVEDSGFVSVDDASGAGQDGD